MKVGRNIAFVIAAIVLTVILFKTGRKSLGLLWDPVSETRLLSLHPKIRNDVRAFINKAESLGIQLRITSATRSFDEQEALYAQGRTDTLSASILPSWVTSIWDDPEPIVTNARAGQSYHNYGLAFDVAVLQDGEGNWDYSDPIWQKVGELGQSFGFEWGGNWTSQDYPHFQKTFGKSTQELMALYYANPNEEFLTV